MNNVLAHNRCLMNSINTKRSGKPFSITFDHDCSALSSFAGLCVIHAWITRLGIREALRKTFRGLPSHLHRMFLLLVIFRLLGFRRLRDADPHRHDPLLLATAGMERIPHVSTIGRCFNRHFGEAALGRIRSANLRALAAIPQRGAIRTLDFDGTVFRTRRKAQNTATGFNPSRKGERSYYPLFCTLAQTSQVLDVLHRPGNVHDSNGAAAFMEACIAALPAGADVEVRADSAFFGEGIVATLDPLCRFTLSLPFARFPVLKGRIEARRKWARIDAETDCFEMAWRPESWSHRRVRLIAVRRRQKVRRKGPLQLDLFEPMDFEYSYSVVATNDDRSAGRLVSRHHGRGSQEGLLGELKDQLHAGVTVFKTQAANAGSMWASIYAHNLLRTIQMATRAPERDAKSWKRPACWSFQKAKTLRGLIVRAARIKRPQNRTEIVVAGDREIVENIKALMPKGAAAC